MRFLDPEFERECHERWSKESMRLSEERLASFGVIDDTTDADLENVPDEYYNQCGECQFFRPLCFVVSADWGVCACADAERDGKVVFEHHGCPSFLAADEWFTGKFGCVETDGK